MIVCSSASIGGSHLLTVRHMLLHVLCKERLKKILCKSVLDHWLSSQVRIVSLLILSHECSAQDSSFLHWVDFDYRQHHWVLPVLNIEARSIWEFQNILSLLQVFQNDWMCLFFVGPKTLTLFSLCWLSVSSGVQFKVFWMVHLVIYLLN